MKIVINDKKKFKNAIFFVHECNEAYQGDERMMKFESNTIKKN